MRSHLHVSVCHTVIRRGGAAFRGAGGNSGECGRWRCSGGVFGWSCVHDPDGIQSKPYVTERIHADHAIHIIPRPTLCNVASPVHVEKEISGRLTVNVR